MKIKVEPFLIRKGHRVAKAAIEFESTDSFLAGFHLVGFTICDDAEKGLFVLFPASIINKRIASTDAHTDALALKMTESKPFFFLRPNSADQIAKLESLILDTYEEMMKVTTTREK